MVEIDGNARKEVEKNHVFSLHHKTSSTYCTRNRSALVPTNIAAPSKTLSKGPHLLREGTFEEGFVAFGGERLRHFLGPFSVSPLGAGADHIEDFEEVSAGHLESKKKQREGEAFSKE